MGFVKCMSYSIIGSIYALQMKRLNSITKYEWFNFASYSIFIISILILLFAGLSYPQIKTFLPIINIRFIAYIFAIAASILYLKWTKNGFFNYLALNLGAILITAETVDLFHKLNLYGQTSVAFSIAWLLYSGTIILTGIFKDIKPLKLTGIWIVIITILKIIFFDMANVEAIYKVMAFLSLGVILMIVSYFYAKNRGE